jgi:hypothetical protein
VAEALRFHAHSHATLVKARISYSIIWLLSS